MSAHALAAPDLDVNVRCTRQSEENRGEEEEYQVTFDGILEDNEHHTDPESQKARPHTQKNPAAAKRISSKTAVALGVMYLLILAGIFIRYVLVSLENYQLQTSYDKLSNNYTQLQAKNSVNNNQLQDEINQLKDKTEDEKINNNQLQDEIKQLKDKIEGKCPDGWKRFRCSCYFKSSERRTWYNSRSDCQNKGADLVVINNKEEQKFITDQNVYREFWIGLRATERRQEWVWEWVDGSPLTEMFWESGLSQYSAYQDAAASCYQQRCWSSGQNDKKYWVCEK